MPDDTLRLLVSGSKTARKFFEVLQWNTALFQESRGETACFTAASEAEASILDVAKDLDLTVQRIIGAGASESYETMHQGSHPGWSKKPCPAPPSS